MKHTAIDKTGSALALLCSVHCLFLPVFLTAVPLVGLSMLADERVELAFLATSACFAAVSICWGFTKHGKPQVFAIVAVAFGCVTAGHIYEMHGLAALGGCGVAASHLLNMWLCARCVRCSHTH